MHITVKVGQQRLGPHSVAIMQAARLNLDETVDVREEGGRIVIEPVHSPKEYNLMQLLKGITPKNMHKRSTLAMRSARSF